jgi:hypothetical protein
MHLTCFACFILDFTSITFGEEYKFLRHIFGPVEENGIWRRRYNLELYKLFNEPDIIRFIKVKRFEWAGHLIPVSEIRMIKKIFNTKPEVTRKVGRPRLRWKECVWQDIRILGVRNWRSVASNREEWLAILRKPRAHTGLLCLCCCCCCWWRWWWWWWWSV